MRWPPELFFAFLSFLLGSGLQVSGYTSAYLATFFFCWQPSCLVIGRGHTPEVCCARRAPIARARPG
jgi:hypothetical protein